MVEIVLPHEHLCLSLIIGQAHITCQSVACHEYVAAIGTLQNDFALSLVNDTETRLCGVVLRISVVEHPMFQSNSRFSCRQIDDTERLAVWDILASVSLGLNHSKIVELGIAALLPLTVKAEECMT